MKAKPCITASKPGMLFLLYPLKDAKTNIEQYQNDRFQKLTL